MAKELAIKPFYGTINLPKDRAAGPRIEKSSRKNLGFFLAYLAVSDHHHDGCFAASSDVPIIASLFNLDGEAKLIKIDEEFKKAIPPLAIEEFRLLELSLRQDGCRDPLVVWGEILVDGHNRFEICSRHGIRFETVQKEFGDREAALDWIDANQLGRRNLSPDSFKLLLGRRYNRVKKAHGGQPENKCAEKRIDQIDPFVSAQGPSPLSEPTQNVPQPQATTAQKLAKEHGVGEATVKRAAKFAEAVESSPRLQEAIENNVPVIHVVRQMKEEKREERRQENAAKIQAIVDVAPQELIKSDAKFSTIVIDPPLTPEQRAAARNLPSWLGWVLCFARTIEASENSHKIIQ